ncbi:endonuclease subunit [uncultured Caudovirales phage]|uniref:Endonuclease subunit n=1 Tax=uncultured Caudovirales phage TaxID=2100421 RepID=A0A6J5L0Z9_9CAUD|nr:endonuclease subunit [uncultured Caudovirales phage]
MPRLLLVGDPHVTVEEMPDCQKLIDYTLKVAIEQKVDRVVFMGDLYHTHALVHTGVMEFWRNAFAQFKAKRFKVGVLLGNHDQPGNSESTSHALLAHSGAANVDVWDTPEMEADFGYIPYCHTPDHFVKTAKQLADGGAKTILCHQTFAGSVYENGFFAKDGVNPDELPAGVQFISGHIHTPQEFGPIWYIGAPRWRTLSDANIDRNIWVIDVDGDGVVTKRTPFSMKGICREIRYLKIQDNEVKEGNALTDEEGNLVSTIDWRIDSYGSVQHNDQLKKEFARPGVKIRCFNTDVSKVTVKESDGIDNAFMGFMGTFKPKHGTPTDKLASMFKERFQ